MINNIPYNEEDKLILGNIFLIAIEISVDMIEIRSDNLYENKVIIKAIEIVFIKSIDDLFFLIRLDKYSTIRPDMIVIISVLAILMISVKSLVIIL